MPISALAALVALVALACTACGTDGSTPADPAAVDSAERGVTGETVTVSWFVGLGTGSRPEQVAAQEEVVADFNAQSDDIELEIELVDNEIAFDVLQERIANGRVPDIIGPIGIRGSNAFAGQFLDLAPLMDEAETSLAPYDPEQVEVWREENGALTALPFGVFPSFLLYNTELFDRAGLPYPPHEFGGLYEGEEWTFDALADLAERLTLDADGISAAEPDFDPAHIVQWGFNHQFVGEPRSQGTLFGAGSIVADDGSAQIPDPWLAEWQWYHDLVWESHAAPNQTEMDSGLLDRGDTFNSGNVAIAFTHLWYTGSLLDATGAGQQFFDLAALPAYEGTVTSKVHADTFRIFESTAHPAESFEVLTYLLGEAAPELLHAYGSLPARTDLRTRFFDQLDRTFPQGVDWAVAEDALAHPDIPSHEGPMPAMAESQLRLDAFGALLAADGDIDVVDEAKALIEDLDAIWTRGS